MIMIFVIIIILIIIIMIIIIMIIIIIKSNKFKNHKKYVYVTMKELYKTQWYYQVKLCYSVYSMITSSR